MKVRQQGSLLRHLLLSDPLRGQDQRIPDKTSESQIPCSKQDKCQCYHYLESKVRHS